MTSPSKAAHLCISALIIGSAAFLPHSTTFAAARWYLIVPQNKTCSAINSTPESFGKDFCSVKNVQCALKPLNEKTKMLYMEGGDFVLFTTDKHECAKFGSPPAQNSSAARTPFDVYQGKLGPVRIAIEARDKGTMLMVINDGPDPFEINPTELAIVTEKDKSSPCTLHMMSMMGLGSPLLTVTVAPHQKEAYLLGACPSLANGGSLTGAFIISAVVKQIFVGSQKINLIPSNAPM